MLLLASLLFLEEILVHIQTHTEIIPGNVVPRFSFAMQCGKKRVAKENIMLSLNLYNRKKYEKNKLSTYIGWGSFRETNHSRYFNREFSMRNLLIMCWKTETRKKRTLKGIITKSCYPFKSGGMKRRNLDC